MSHSPNGKHRTIKLLQVIALSSIIGKPHTTKQAVNSPKTNDVKLFIKDENQPVGSYCSLLRLFVDDGLIGNYTTSPINTNLYKKTLKGKQ